MFSNSGKRIVKFLNHIQLSQGSQEAVSFDFSGSAATDILSKRFEECEGMTVAPARSMISELSEDEGIDLSFFKVLVAEDNLINQKIFQKMLQKMNVRFKVVGNGTEVLEALSNDYFDLVLMDCYMPQMSGFEAASLIRSSEGRFSKIPVIAFSAGLYDHDLKASQDAGMNDFLLKPVSFDQLRAKISLWAHRVYKSLPTLDTAALDKIRVFDDKHQTLLYSLFQIYSENTQEELYKMRDLVQDGAVDLIRRKAHMLKSSAAQLGAFRFEKFCILMEHEEFLDHERMKVLYEGMCEEYEKSRKRFFEYCQNLSQIPNVLM